MNRIVPVLASVLFIAGVGVARAEIRTACADDVKSYCKGIEPKGGKLRDCMAENRAKLSNTCKLAVADRLLEKQAKAAEAKKSGKGMAPKDDDD